MLRARDEASERASIIPAINWQINLENANRVLLFSGNQDGKIKEENKSLDFKGTVRGIQHVPTDQKQFFGDWRSGAEPEATTGVTLCCTSRQFPFMLFVLWS